VRKVTSHNSIQVIARAAAILRALKGASEGLSLGEIAGCVGLARSTVQRIVGALQAERLVITAGPAGGIRLGPELQSLADAARIDLVKLVRPLLQDLWLETGETVDLAILRNNKLIFIDQIPGAHRLRAVSSIGVVFPLTNTANGKACLALMSGKDVKAIAQAEWIAARTKGNLTKLLQELRTVRNTGVAYDLNEHTDGISAAGIAFQDELGGCYAVSIPTPSTRFSRNRHSLTNSLLRTADRITRLKGQQCGSI
jgi:DNA-binding IclR family transcriptional regulator